MKYETLAFLKVIKDQGKPWETIRHYYRIDNFVTWELDHDFLENYPECYQITDEIILKTGETLWKHRHKVPDLSLILGQKAVEKSLYAEPQRFKKPVGFDEIMAKIREKNEETK